MALTVPMSYSYGGLTFGGIGQDVQVLSAAGVRGFGGNVRMADTPWPQRDGDAAGVATLDERTMQFGLQVMAPVAPFESVLAGAAAAFTPVQNPAQLGVFQCYLSSSWVEARQCLARPTAYDVPIDTDYNANLAKPAVQFTAPDPLWYSASLHSQTTGLPSPTAGAMPPFTFNLPFGASTGGSMQAVNAGNYPTAPVITITGPCTNPTVSLGSAFIFLNLTLNTGDTVVIDMGARTVTFNGALRQNSPQQGSTWWTLPVGTSTIGVASQDSASVAAQFTIQWRDAWSSL